MQNRGICKNIAVLNFSASWLNTYQHAGRILHDLYATESVLMHSCRKNGSKNITMQELEKSCNQGRQRERRDCSHEQRREIRPGCFMLESSTHSYMSTGIIVDNSSFGNDRNNVFFGKGAKPGTLVRMWMQRSCPAAADGQNQHLVISCNNCVSVLRNAVR